MTAAIGGFIAIIIFLLNPGPGIKPAEVNKQDREQRTALINAVLNDKEDCVTLLTENGANPNLYSRNGWTPLYIAANKGYTNIATKLLFQYGRNSTTKGTSYHTLNVDMAIQNTVGGTVLMVASMQGHYQIVESLLRSGADVNVKDKQNWTALMKAADKGNLEVVKLLLANGADVLVADNVRLLCRLQKISYLILISLFGFTVHPHRLASRHCTSQRKRAKKRQWRFCCATRKLMSTQWTRFVSHTCHSSIAI